ncbi:hypothetical protein B296_00051797 [Ensete ventricosum]|uniref:LisH domain-containing protein n=1 Tax=Ensete ventricosum TaxID=4639 RepID=A0A426X3J3_ENSVE|nr:hypothetical protein B296_00051797 [Ensete ventricosum]
MSPGAAALRGGNASRHRSAAVAETRPVSISTPSLSRSMVDSVNVVLEFLKKNRFTKAEAALRGELNARPDLNGFLQKHLAEEKEVGRTVGEVDTVRQQSTSSQIAESSKEFVVKEIEVGGIGNGFGSKKGCGVGQGRESGSVDLYPWNFISTANTSSVSKNTGTENNFADILISEEPKHRQGSFVLEKRDRAVGVEPDWPAEQRVSYDMDMVKTDVEVKPDISQVIDHKDQTAYSQGHVLDDPRMKNGDPGCSVKTPFPFPMDNASSGYVGRASERREFKHKINSDDIRESTKEQLDDMSRSSFDGKSLDSAEPNFFKNFDGPVTGGHRRDELPRLPPVRLKSEDKVVNLQWEEKADCHESGMKPSNADTTIMIGSYLDVPVGQEINSSGIAEDTSDLVSGFATVGDESLDYPNEYWDSDEYDDDDDVGYTRQPIEDETWFLAHEVDCPSDNEKGTGHGSVLDHQDQAPIKDEDDTSFAEEDSYLSGEQYLPTKNVEQVAISAGSMGHKMLEMYDKTDESDLIAHYDGQLMDADELSLMRSEPVWRGFVAQNNELMVLDNGKGPNDVGRSHQENPFTEDDQRGSVRSIGMGINSDAADIGSEVRESLVGGSSEGDMDFFPDQGVSARGRSYHQNDTSDIDMHRPKREKMRGNKQDGDILACKNDISLSGVSTDGGFSFPPLLKTRSMLEDDSGKSLSSSKANAAYTPDECANGSATDDMLATWRRNGSDSSPVKSSRDEEISDAARSRNSSASSGSNYGYAVTESISKGHHEENEISEEDPGATLEDEEAAALQEQIRQIKVQLEEFETFYLKIVHRKNRHAYLHHFFVFSIILNHA